MFLLAILSRLNLLSKQIDVIENEMALAESRLDDLKERFTEQGLEPP